MPLDAEVPSSPVNSPQRQSIGPEDEDLYAGPSLALYSFEPENPNELRLREMQVIMVSYRHGQGWLVAEPTSPFYPFKEPDSRVLPRPPICINLVTPAAMWQVYVRVLAVAWRPGNASCITCISSRCLAMSSDGSDRSGVLFHRHTLGRCLANARPR